MDERTGTSGGKLPRVLYVAFAFGLVLLGFAVRGTVRDVRFVSSAVRTEGTVIGILERQSGAREGVVYVPRFTFLTAEGRMVKVLSDSGYSTSLFPVGGKVPVLYQAADPQGAKIDSFTQLWVNDWVLFLVGLVFAGLPAFVWVRAARGRLV